MKPHEKNILIILVVCAAVIRAVHLGGPLDEPMWRQTDTAYMARRMMNESPPDLLNPKAPYRGLNDVKAAEYPIYPAVVSLAYRALGRESIPAARVVSLLFFCGSAWFLFSSIRLLAGVRFAAWTTVIYMLAPLGIAYSRMVHPDFSIIFFSHLFLYGLLRFVDTEHWRWWLLATLGGVAAFLMKAPYCFFLGLLPGWWWLTDQSKRTLGRFIGLAVVFILPLMAAIWFNQHRIAQESTFDESLIYPMKWTAESSAGRFFGHLSDRADVEGWKLIAKRIIFMVLTPFGVLLGVLGVFPTLRVTSESTVHREWVPWIWLFGAVLYILIVFPMVIGGHEYYTIPLMAPAALLAARGVVNIIDWLNARESPYAMTSLIFVVIFILAGMMAGISRGPYLSGFPFFDVDWQRVRAGELIKSNTSSDDLVISVTHGRSTGWSDPRILYYADRLGWTIEAKDLTDSILSDYMSAGATIAAVLVTPEAEVREGELGPLAKWSYKEVRMINQGRDIGSVRFYEIGDERNEP